MAPFSTTAIRLHVAALDLAEQAFEGLSESDPSRASSLSNLHIARQMLALTPANVRAAHQIFREVCSIFPDYEKTNLPIAKAINAARDAV
jgi:hypothetical protein